MASGPAGRPDGEAAPTSYRPSPDSAEGHDHAVKQPRVRGGESRWGARAPGPHLLSRPVPESGFQRSRFPNTPLILWVNAGR